MNTQSSATVWSSSPAVRVAVLEPNAGFSSYSGAGTLGTGKRFRPATTGSAATLALLASNVATWLYVAALPAGLAA